MGFSLHGRLKSVSNSPGPTGSICPCIEVRRRSAVMVEGQEGEREECAEGKRKGGKGGPGVVVDQAGKERNAAGAGVDVMKASKQPTQAISLSAIGLSA